MFIQKKCLKQQQIIVLDNKLSKHFDFPTKKPVHNIML